MIDPKTYNVEVQAIIDSLPLETIEKIAKLLHKARIQGKRVYIFGNGGSASTANHMATDLFKGTRNKLPRLKALSLNSNMSLVSAFANDTSYPNIFRGQLEGVIEKNDVAIGISGSGKSKNVLAGLAYAKEMGARTIALTGFDGGEVCRVVEVCLIVPSQVMEQIEDIHLMIGHILTVMLRSMDV